MTPAESSCGIVLSCTRRVIKVLTERGETITATAATKALELTPGDRVELTFSGKDIVVSSFLERRNFLSRSLGTRSKRVAANLDQLFIITAPPPVLNTFLIDRMLTVSSLNEIEATVILNKSDLGLGDAEAVQDAYRKIGLSVLTMSALRGSGMQEFADSLAKAPWKTIALAGSSGVGKTTILNALIPTAGQRTQELSEKTGQGKQTTTQSIGHCFPRSSEPDLIVIDLPGVQYFGVTHLTAREVRDSFTEFFPFAAECEYTDCAHSAEPTCAVKRAVAEGTIARSRYDSYLHMISEISSHKPYD